MEERSRTRRQYLLLVGVGGVAGLSGCASGGDGGSGQEETRTTTEPDEAGNTTDGDGTERPGEDETPDSTASESSGAGREDLTPWLSRYAGPQKTRSTPDPAPADLETRTSYGAGGTVAVTDTGVFGLGLNVSRADPSTGENVFNRRAPVGEALFVQDGIVVCGESTGGGRVAGLDAETGERRWLVEPGGTIAPFPAGDGIGYAGTHIGVLDPASGDTRWNRDRSLLSPNQRQGITSYGYLFTAAHPESNTAFAYNGNEIFGIEAFDLASGEVRWRRDELGSAGGTLPAAVRGDTMYVYRLNNLDGEILALDRGSGDEQWRATGLDVWKRGGINGLAVDGDRVYVGSGQNMLAYDPSDGSEQWSVPVPKGGGVLIATGDALVRVTGRIEVYSKTDGELRRSAGVGERVTPDLGSGAAVAGGRLYLPTAGVSGGIAVYGTG